MSKYEYTGKEILPSNQNHVIEQKKIFLILL